MCQNRVTLLEESRSLGTVVVHCRVMSAEEQAARFADVPNVYMRGRNTTKIIVEMTCARTEGMMPRRPYVVLRMSSNTSVWSEPRVSKK